MFAFGARCLLPGQAGIELQLGVAIETGEIDGLRIGSCFRFRRLLGESGGDKFLDVIAEGDYVAPGGRVQVIEIEGSRIVVKEI